MRIMNKLQRTAKENVYAGSVEDLISKNKHK